MLDEVGQNVGFNTCARESGSKIYPESLENKSAPYCFAQKMARDRSACEDMCLAALDLLEVLEEEDDRVTKAGKTRHWISEEEKRL